jgi:hypothetical protein
MPINSGDTVDGEFVISFDPFAHGFSFAVGFNKPLDPKIGTLELNYITEVGFEPYRKNVAVPLSLKKCSALEK